METLFNEDDRLYLKMMQENIERMASNSANCKNWTLGLIGGITALGSTIDSSKAYLSLLLILLVLVFWYLNTFYLQIERKMRNRELDFVIKARKSHSSQEYKNALFYFKPLPMKKRTEEQKKLGFELTNDRFFSKSIAPFYIMVIVLIVSVAVIVANWERFSWL